MSNTPFLGIPGQAASVQGWGLTLHVKDHVLEHLAADPSLRIHAPGLTWHPCLGPEHGLGALPGRPDDLQAHGGGHLQGTQAGISLEAQLVLWESVG